jgi:nicotinate-nucleotide adenylyltransferase
MGGTFDPIHLGHLIAANEVAATLALDIVVFVPAARPWQKDGSVGASPEHRYAMVRLATSSNPRFTVSRADLDRQGPTYTIDTLGDIQAEYGPEAQLYFLAGADTLATLPTWREPERLATLARIVAMTRPGYAIPAGQGWERVEVPQLAVSSSDCRDRARAGRPLRYLVPAPVEEYIAEHHLYQE